MKVAIVHDFLTKLGGAEKVLHAISNLYPEAPIFTLLYDEKGTNSEFKDKKIITSTLQNYPHWLKKPKLLLSKYPKAIEEFDLSKYDLVISSSNSFAHGVLTKPKTLHLCYCHSPMRYAWDWYHEYLKEHGLGFGLKGLLARNLIHKIRIWDKVSSERVDSWIANSANVQERIQKFYRKKSQVIYPPIDIRKIPFNKEKKDFYIVVSRLEPYKKIDLVVETFNKNNKTLIVIGTGGELERLKSIAYKNISFLGWQDDKTVYEMISDAKALIFPGEEDFGITPVEAMAAGTPVIAFDKGGVKESVIEKKTGIFFRELTLEALNQAINSFEASNISPEDCLNRAENFSLEVFNKQFAQAVARELDNYHKEYEKS